MEATTNGLSEWLLKQKINYIPAVWAQLNSLKVLWKVHSIYLLVFFDLLNSIERLKFRINNWVQAKLNAHSNLARSAYAQAPFSEGREE
jgi:hypothetical protein